MKLDVPIVSQEVQDAVRATWTESDLMTQLVYSGQGTVVEVEVYPNGP